MVEFYGGAMYYKEEVIEVRGVKVGNVYPTNKSGNLVVERLYKVKGKGHWVDVKFINTGSRKTLVRVPHMLLGQVKDKSTVKKYQVKAPIEYSGIVIGETYYSNHCGKFKVTGILSGKTTPLAEVEFLATGTKRATTLGNVRKGQVKDNFHPTIHGVGYLGDATLKGNTVSYSVWSNMLGRCYDSTNTRHYCYGAVGVTVDTEWHNFSNFLSWWEEYYIEGYQLDKDLLAAEDVKVYSSDTCCFLPARLNATISNLGKGSGVRLLNGKWNYGISRGGWKNKAFDTEIEAKNYRAEYFKHRLETFLQEDKVLPANVRDAVVGVFNRETLK